MNLKFISLSQEKRIVSQRIANAENKMAEFHIDIDSSYSRILAHARQEFAAGNYRQAIKDLESIQA